MPSGNTSCKAGPHALLLSSHHSVPSEYSEESARTHNYVPIIAKSATRIANMRQFSSNIAREAQRECTARLIIHTRSRTSASL
jgi:hypothetical protein